MKKKIIKTALLNAVATTIYIIGVVTLMSYASSSGINGPELLAGVVMLLLFVISAAVTSLLVFGRPVLWYLDGKKKEALSLLGYTLGFLFIIAVLIFLTAFFGTPRRTIDTINGIKINVEIADSPQEWERGLSGKKSLNVDEGMLFVFPRPTTPTFWMKDMRFPIDIVWLDENKNIVGIERGVSPDSYPETYKPPIAVLYALETNPGLIPF